jgi:hypothetical protein
MIRDDVGITDLVDTIESQLKKFAHAKDTIEEKHHIQPDGIARFYEQIARLRTILDNHRTPRA